MPVLGRILAVLAAAAALCAPGMAQAKWLRAESPRFIIYSDGNESQLRKYVEQMEVFDSLLRIRHGLPENGVPARKLPIYLVTSRAELQVTVTAYKQAPQVAPLRWELIQVLMARRNWPQAEALLKPLLNDPHNAAIAEKSRELMKRIQEGKAAGS